MHRSGSRGPTGAAVRGGRLPDASGRQRAQGGDARARVDRHRSRPSFARVRLAPRPSGDRERDGRHPAASRDRARPKDPRRRRAPRRDGRHARRGPPRPTRSRAVDARVVRRLPPLRARRAHRRRRRPLERGPHRDPSPLEGRPGGQGRRKGHPLRLAGGALPRPLARRVARVGRHHRGADLPLHRPARRHPWRGSRRSERRENRSADGGGCGLDATTVAGHSLRAGFATTAAKRGKSLDAIMRQTLHKSERVARSYIRHAKLFDDNAAVGLL